MTMTNHMMTGAVIALVIKQPALTLPLALLSHFVLDALPHYGRRGEEHTFSRLTRAVIITDVIIAVGFLLWLVTSGYYMAGLAAMTAASPDTVWAYRVLRMHLYGRMKPQSLLTKFHARIQWGERTWGLVIELAYTVSMLVVLRGLVA